MRFFKSCRRVKQTRAREMLFRRVYFGVVTGSGACRTCEAEESPAEETPREL